MAPSWIEAVPNHPEMQIKVGTTISEVLPPAPGAAHIEHDAVDILQAKNPSLQVTADRQIKMTNAHVTRPGRGQVLLHIKATGICGSDIHFWKRGAIGTLTVDGDCILGHEAAGIVLEVGEGVKAFQKGDRVAIEPQVPCGNCFQCRGGRSNLCADVEFCGVYPHHGSLQRFKVHPAQFIHRLPANVTYSQGALLEPLSVVLHALRRAHLSIGRSVVICGAGPIGLIALAAARASGAHPLVITDLEPSRLAFAKEFVPSCQVYQVNPDLDPQGNAKAIRAILGGEYEAPQTILECTGVESSVVTAAYTVRGGGDLMVIGVGKDIMNNLPFMHISLSEINLKYINRYCDTWPAGISALSGGILNLDKLITHTFPLEQAIEAMELCSDVTRGSIKVHVVDDRDIEL